MTDLVLIRHGPTAWNRLHQVQGHSDIPLDDGGRETVRGWSVPGRFSRFRWTASPLSRAKETAELLGAIDLALEPRLMERNWGPWEGSRLSDLREELGDLMAAWEAQGLDFRAPGGESTRDMQNRLLPWLQETAQAAEPTIAVSHKGVIRAIYALATGWDMTSKPPDKILDGHAHLYRLSASGHPEIIELNITLETRDRP